MFLSFFRCFSAGTIAAMLFTGVIFADDISVSQTGVSRVNTTFDPLKDIGESETVPVLDTAAPVQEPAIAPTIITPEPVAEAQPPVALEKHRGFLFDYTLSAFSKANYARAVSTLFEAYEKETGRQLVPAEKKKVALKIYTASGKGLATPQNLTRAVRDALEQRGFARENILIVDLSEKSLRRSGYLPPFRRGNDTWEGCPVVALDTGRFYNEKWFFENPLPSREAYLPDASSWDTTENDRKSFLPIPLLFDVDFWINLPVAVDSPAIGVSGAIANATLWNVSNQRRFLDSPGNAALAAVSIATIPEFKAKFEFTLLSLEKYQFIGGPKFNAEYTTGENRIWLSANPVVLDYLLWERMNAIRIKRGFDPILPEPPLFSMASKGSVSLGSCINSEITLINLPSKEK